MEAGERKPPGEVENTPETDYPPQQVKMRSFISGDHEILVIGGWMAEEDEEKYEQVHDVVPHEG